MKSAFITFGTSAVVFTLLLGAIRWHGTDDEYRYYTAVRMHACDIYTNDHATLKIFRPDACTVKRRSMLLGQLIDVTCSSEDQSGRVSQFQYGYSDVHPIFDQIFGVLQKGKQCQG